MSDVARVCFYLFSCLWAYFLLFCLFKRGLKELFYLWFFDSVIFFSIYITAGILCGTELCNNICAYQTTIWMGGKWLNLVHMHEVNEDLTIAGLQITNTKENQRLGRGGIVGNQRAKIISVALHCFCKRFLQQLSKAVTQQAHV